MIHAVIAVNNLGFIGKGDALPWGKSSRDMKMFWKLIANELVLVGSNTYRTMPQSRLEQLCDGVHVATRSKRFGNVDLEDFLDKCDAFDRDVYVIGGLQIYQAVAHRVDVWHITRINDDTIGDKAVDIDQLIYAQKIK